MQNSSAVIEKIRKLLALANSQNEHEAALAATHAQRLLAEHNLAIADVEEVRGNGKADRIETTVSKTLPKWIRHLSFGVSAAFDCQAVHHPAHGKMTFIGVGADAQIAAYTFIYLDRTVRKLCREYVKNHPDNANAPKRHSELLKHSYLLGVVSTIITRLQEQKIQTPVTSTALVPLKEQLILQALKEIGPIRTRHSRRSYINADAYATGKSDGTHIGLRKGMPGPLTEQGLLDKQSD